MNGLRTVDQIELKEMILPLVVVDVHAEVAKNPDYTLTRARLKNGRPSGPIPVGAFVAMRTDWSKRWPTPTRWRIKGRTVPRIIQGGARKP